MMSIKQEPDTVTDDQTELKPGYSGRDMELKNEESSPQVKIECDFQEEDSALPNTTLLQGQEFESTDPIDRDQGRTLNDSGCHEGYFDNINLLQGKETSAMGRYIQYTNNHVTDTLCEDEGSLLQHQEQFHGHSSQMALKSEVNMPNDNSIDNNIHVSEPYVKDFHEDHPTNDHVLPNQQDQMKVYKCGTCSYSSNYLFDLYQHNTCHHTMGNFYIGKTQYLCDLCGYRCVMDKAISRHITRHLSGKRYSCDFCEYTCDFPYHMKQHITKHTGIKPYSCDLCDYTCALPAYLREHKRKKHDGEKPYSSDRKVPDNKKSNAGRKPSNTGKTPYSCDFCGYTSEKAYKIKRHRRKHTGEKPYSCDVCDFTCAYQCSLAKHRRLHTGERPYSCDVCDYTCIKSSALTQHKRKHTGEKPYSCDVCDYSCAASSYLKVHKRTHTGEKPYSCDLCDLTFAKLASLKKHKLKHIRSCDLCDYTCAQVSDLNEHMRNHEALEEKPVVHPVNVKMCDNVSY